MSYIGAIIALMFTMPYMPKHLGAFALGLLIACGGEGDPGPLPDGQTVDPTAPGGTDVPTTPTPPTPAACHPVTQAGCAPGQKCASVAGVTQCVDAAGAVRGAGEDCAAGVTGADNCAPGFHCQGGRCAAICGRSAPFRCTASGQNCVATTSVFADVFGESVGLCSDPCNPVEQGCEDGFGCYLDVENVSASCLPVRPEAVALGQGQQCNGPEAGGCYRNGCAAGFGALLPASFASPVASLCTQYCNPVDTHTLATGNGAGDPAGVQCPDGFQCRFVQTFFSDARSVPADIGMCVPASVWGDCDLCDISTPTTFLQTCTGQNAHGCVSGAILRR